MNEPRWLRKDAVLAIHHEQLLLTGGADGLRDGGLLESALGRPRNQWGYAETSIPELAAAYAFGICQNHPFVDGNKRTAFLAMYTFLGLNGYSLDATDEEATAAMLELASGGLKEAEFASWVLDHARRA